MGSCGWRAVRRIFALENVPERISHAAGSSWVAADETRVFAVGHPGPQGLTNRPWPRQLADWRRIGVAVSTILVSDRRPDTLSIMDSAPCIRPARIEEAPALLELCARSKASWGYDDTFMALVRIAFEGMQEQVAAGDVWVATGADGTVAGMVALGPSDQPNTLDLDKLFVEPRRIRTGVGRALLAYAISEARRRGADRLTILADPYAAGFYERNGARLIGQAPSDAIPGRSLPLYEIKLD